MSRNLFTGNVYVADRLVVPKTAGKAILVDLDTPTPGWADMLGQVHVRAPGANDPTLAVYQGAIRQFSFSNAITNEIFNEFHVPHDYLSGTDVFIHVHWSQIVVDTGGPAGVPGTVKWSFDVSYAKGHQQAPFSLPFTTFVTQPASAVQFQHQLVEIQLSALAPTPTQLDTALLEPDGIILVRTWRDAADPADTLNQVPFMHYLDLHYQTTGITGTKQKAPNFYV